MQHVPHCRQVNPRISPSHQFYFLILLSIVEIIGDFSFEKFANSGLPSAFGMGLAGYAGVIFFLIKSLAGSSILYVNAIWDGISSLLESFAAYFFLGERFQNPLQYLGVAFIIIGMFFLKQHRIPQ